MSQNAKAWVVCMLFLSTQAITILLNQIVKTSKTVNYTLVEWPRRRRRQSYNNYCSESPPTD